MASLDQTLTELADGFRKRFKVTDKLSLQDMIKLVEPPKGTLLVNSGKFYFTQSRDLATMTAQNGSTITVNTMIAPTFYTSDAIKLIHDPQTRPNIIIRLHFEVVHTDGKPFTWTVEGSGLVGKWNPVNSNESELTLPTGLRVNEANAIQFVSGGTTVINLATSYITLITEKVGGGE